MKTERVALVNKNVIPVEAPGRILVIPWGEVESKAGNFVVDAEACKAIVDVFTAHGVDLPIDFEHATLGGDYATPDGTAPAMGWIKSLAIEANVGVFANVEWTERGAAFVAAKEYRYLSPVTIVRKSDKRVVALHSVALTNTPAIVGMVPIVNKDLHMDADRILEWRYRLNLPETATPEEIVMELQKLVDQFREILGADAKATGEVIASSLKLKLDELKGLKASHVAVCKAVGAKEDAKGEELVVAINAAKALPASPSVGDPARYVSRAEFDAVANTAKTQGEELAVLKTDSATRRSVERIANAKREGRLTEAMLAANSGGANHFADCARSMADADWSALMERMPVVAPADGRVVANGNTPPAGGSDRVAVIANAVREFKGEPELARITNCEAFVKDALRTAGKVTTITDDEKKLITA